jgi:hypothetical protein
LAARRRTQVEELGAFVSGAGGATTPAELECPRRGIWGTKSLWGRVVTYPGE